MTSNVPVNPSDDLYSKARKLLLADPAMGKKKLADRLGVKTPTSRRLKHRFLGETEGHSQDPDYQRVRHLKSENPDWGATRVAQELGMSLDHAKVHLARWTGAQAFEAAQGSPAEQTVPSKQVNTPSTPSGTAPQAGSTLQDSVAQNARDLTYRGSEIRTLEDLLVYAEVNTSIWQVERWVMNKWEVGARNPATGEILTAPLFQIKAWLRRRSRETSVTELMQAVLEQFKRDAPVRPHPPTRSHGDGMLEIAILDLHYGKLCWGEECGLDYNPQIAEKLFWGALDDLLAKGEGFKPSKILFPVGNDFYHTDILGRTTTAGTPQDSSIVWKQAFVDGWHLLVQAINRLRSIAPVHVPVVNGNHDVQSAFHMGEVLAAWFRNTAGVTIDNRARQRKYIRHHKCLLGLTHGSEEKASSLPMLMASECPADWAASAPAAREWHVGHLHHKRSLKFMPALDVGGVLIRTIPSLTPADAWHASKGYGSKLAAEAFYWDAECGVTATLTHSPL